MIWIVFFSVFCASLLYIVYRQYGELVRKNRDLRKALSQIGELKDELSSCETHDIELNDALCTLKEQEDTIADLQFELSLLNYKLSRKPNKKMPQK